jgi:hypothetical protein
LNPLIAALVEPFARNVRVVPWGMDPSRFPWPPGDGLGEGRPSVALEGGVGRPAPSAEPTPSAIAAPAMTLFIAAVQGEFIKRPKDMHGAGK